LKDSSVPVYQLHTLLNRSKLDENGYASYMCESFVEGLLRKSVPQLEQRLGSVLIERAVLVYIRRV